MQKNTVNNIRLRNEEIRKGIDSKIVTGLVVQGGGMRGIYSCGALASLEEIGLGGAFDQVIGSSAGAINGAYLIAGQAKYAVTAYLDDISNKKFINFCRLRKIVDIDFMVDEVIKKSKPLDVAKARNSFSKLHIVLTDYLTAEAKIVINRDKELDLIEALRATSALPILYNRSVTVNGRNYLDGGVIDAIPLIRAIDLGCTDILVVLTRPLNFRRRRPNLIMRTIMKLLSRNYPPNLKKVLFKEDIIYNETMELIEKQNQLSKEVNITVVYPSNLRKMVSRTTINRNKLLACALMARNDMRRILGLEPLYDNPFF